MCRPAALPRMAHAAVSPRYNGFAADKKYHSAFGGWFPDASVLRLDQATAFAPPGILLDLLSKGASG